MLLAKLSSEWAHAAGGRQLLTRIGGCALAQNARAISRQ